MTAQRARPSKQKKGPEPDAIRARRLELGLTQEEAGREIWATRVSWKNWENGDRPMHPAFWELFLLKTKGRTPKAMHWRTR